MKHNNIIELIEGLFKNQKYVEIIDFFERTNNCDLFNKESINYIITAYLEVGQFSKAEQLVEKNWLSFIKKVKESSLTLEEKEYFDECLLYKIEIYFEYERYFTIICFAYKYRSYLIDKENAIKYVKRSMEELKSNIFNWLLPLCVLLIIMLCLTSIGLISPKLFKFFHALIYCITGSYFLFLLLIKVFNPERVLK